ncbi:hyaluronan mediated motility receptor isoform X2 [Takifugu rubripes]|uniref:hyaluronan mediated motility receptor isoform X2 n=1 Tax=Takifugu rubripes TaxID=31033 RepID=UPI0011453681|nr:hyaluronan mediated motility receptor isoform X2 [Takifugu rubripes]
MSFSRAPLKRFNDTFGCAPPPGTYEIKPEDSKGAASFDKSDRFKLVKAAALRPPSPTRNALVSPVRRTMSVDGLVESSSAKKEKIGMSLAKKQQRQLEKEMRSLVQQRGEQDRRLLILEEELKKVEAKLLAAVRERTSLAANVTTLERQRAELRKANEFLKSKVSADTSKKRINSLTMDLMEARNTLDTKNKELSVLQINTEAQLKVLEADLKSAKSAVTALKDRNKDLEDLHEAGKAHNQELEDENSKLQAVIHGLKQEIKVIQEYLDTANDQIQELRLQLREKAKDNNAVSPEEQVKLLEAQLKQSSTELENTKQVLKQKEEDAQIYQQELQALKGCLLEMEQKLENQELEVLSSQRSACDLEEQMAFAAQKVGDFQAMVRQQEGELARLREVLRRTEKELDERVAHMEQRYLFSEEERSKTQKEGLRRVEELKVELASLKETKRDEKKSQIQLEQKLTAATEELTKEKALVDSLYVLLEQEREESEERLRQLKEEMEEVLGELALLEAQEQKKQEVVEKSQEEVQKLQEETAELERHKNNDVVALKDEHFTALRKLQEEQESSVGKMTDVVTELESTKEALKEAEGRKQELEAEVRRATQEMQQKQEEINTLKEVLAEHCRAKEEISRTLLEVQSCLAQKEEERKARETSQTALIDQLQQHVKERDEALRQREEQRGQSVAQLQDEMEKAQKLMEEVSHEKEEIREQLQHERQEKATIQAALQEKSEALESECINHQETRSELLKLQAELEKVCEERKTLVSHVEHANQSRLDVEKQLEKAEQLRNQLQAHLEEQQQKDVHFQTQLDLSQEKNQSLRRELEQQRGGSRALQEQLQVLAQEKVTLQWEMEEQRQDLQRQVDQAQEKSSPNSEMEHWRKQYEELFAKVRPFQEQLDAFAAERNALLSENGANQEELNKLSDAYARLLGHQNQKQKIKHVMKLKDENTSLKQELSKLRSQVSRLKSDQEQLKSMLPGAPRRRFDPSKAFQHNKENRENEKNEPLREGNHLL